MMSAAWPSFTAAWYSPSAATIFARRSRSASAFFAIAPGILSGSTMSLISTAVTCVPHGSVCRSMKFLICSLMLAVRKKLIEAETSDDIAHGSLTDLIDRVVYVLNHDHRFFRIGNMIVSDRRDVDRDVILGNDCLRGDLHCDGAQRYAHHLLDRNEDEREPRPAHALEFSEKKYDAALVLPQHAKRANEIEDYCNTENVGPVHGISIWLSEQPRLQTKTCRMRVLMMPAAPAARTLIAWPRRVGRAASEQ